MKNFSIAFITIIGLGLVTVGTGCMSGEDPPPVGPDAGTSPVDGAVTSPACADGIDNDGDGRVDLQDPGCTNSQDTDETNPLPTTACADGIDNDGDGRVDFPADPGCTSAGDTDETNSPWSITCPASTDLERITTGVQFWAITPNTPVGAPQAFAANGGGNRVAPATATSVTVLWSIRWEDWLKGPAWWLAHLPMGCVCNLSWPGVPATQPAYWLAGGEGGFGCNEDGRNRHTLP